MQLFTLGDKYIAEIIVGIAIVANVAKMRPFTKSKETTEPAIKGLGK